MELFSKTDAFFAISISVSLFSGLIIIWDMILLFKNRRLAARFKKRIKRFTNQSSAINERKLFWQLDSANENLERVMARKQTEISNLLCNSPGENDIPGLQAQFDMLYPDFISSVNSIIKGITPNEIRLCMLIRLNIPTKEIARLQNVTPDSINKARYRLRCKIGLPSGGDLYQFLSCM